MDVQRRNYSSVLCAALCAVAINTTQAETKEATCFYVSSYHQGHEWTDEIGQSLNETLNGRCELIQIHLGALEHQSIQESTLAGRAAFETMKDIEPDVVITSDDSAAKYFLEPYSSLSSTPFVFTGINWTIEEYKLSRDNVTGIIEVAPIKLMLLEGIRIIGANRSSGNRIAYLGANSLSERKDYQGVMQAASKLGMTTDAILVDDFATWRYGFELAQQYDIVILGSIDGIRKWNTREAIKIAQRQSRKLSMTSNRAMMPYSLIGFTKVAKEHGEWAAATAISIMDGVQVSEIPIVSNSRWDKWINETLNLTIQLGINESMLRDAKIYQ
ncbi:MAG: hypothetical protein KTR32_12620 [Granulosicoccus sp.]|nr:hypothetical protein [Granulosicoccus sp.]